MISNPEIFDENDKKIVVGDFEFIIDPSDFFIVEKGLEKILQSPIQVFDFIYSSLEDAENSIKNKRKIYKHSFNFSSGHGRHNYRF